MINGSIFPTKMQRRGSKQHWANCLGSTSHQNFATAAAAYRFGLKIAASTIRREIWPKIQLNALFVGYHLARLRNGASFPMILCTSSGSAHS
jgi:hypothetical protein